MKSNLFPLFGLLFILLTAAGCTKKAQTVSLVSEPARVIDHSRPGNRPSFVTERTENPAQAKPSTPIPTASPAAAAPAREDIPTISFDSKETEHVRIVDYNPFGEATEMTIDLNRLKTFFCYPYAGNMISNYGMRSGSMHTGVDIKAVPNDTVRAALGGVVRMAKLYSGYGNIVVIRHPCGLETAYSHNSKNLVKPNDIVRAGDPIALAGRTGRATTEHVHFETRIMGEHFDPNLILDTQNRTMKSGTLYLKRQNGRIYASNSVSESIPDNSASLALNTQNPRNRPARTVPPTEIPENYTVQRGDTLYSISQRCGLTVDQICEINGISRDGILSIGQLLKIK